MGVPARRSHSLATLGIAPALLVLALAVWFVSDRLVTIGPFDRAKIGWAVVVPLLALAPGAAALGGSSSTSQGLARLIVALTSIVTSIVVVFGLASAITFVDCRPATSPLEVVPRTLPTAFALGVGFAISTAAAWRPALHARRLAVVLVGAAVWVVAAAIGLFALFVSFPPLSCGAPQT
jgi:hypothetical protein